MQTDKRKKYLYSLAELDRGKHHHANKQNGENISASCKQAADNKRLEGELRECRDTIKLQQEKIEQLENRYEQVIDRMRSDYMALEGSTSQIERLVREKDEEVRRLRQQNEQLKGQHSVSTLKLALEEKDLCITQLSRELEKLSTAFRGHEQTVSNLNDQLSRQKSHSETLESQNSRLKQEIFGNVSQLKLVEQQFKIQRTLKQIELADLARTLDSEPLQTEQH